MSQPTVTYKPEEDGHLVIFKPCWVADNGHETAVFATKDEAIVFARKRWHEEPRIVGSH